MAPKSTEAAHPRGAYAKGLARRQEILDAAQRQRVSHIHHHDQTNDFWRAVEIPERVAHGPKLPQHGMARKIALTSPFKLVAVALANKMARIAFAILRGKTTYREIPA